MMQSEQVSPCPADSDALNSSSRDPVSAVKLSLPNPPNSVNRPASGLRVSRLLRVEHYDIDDSTTRAASTRSWPRYVPGTSFLAAGAAKASPA